MSILSEMIYYINVCFESIENNVHKLSRYKLLKNVETCTIENAYGGKEGITSLSTPSFYVGNSILLPQTKCDFFGMMYFVSLLYFKSSSLIWSFSLCVFEFERNVGFYILIIKYSICKWMHSL